MDKLIFDKSRAGSRGYELPPAGVPSAGAMDAGLADVGQRGAGLSDAGLSGVEQRGAEEPGARQPAERGRDPRSVAAALLPGVALRTDPPALPEASEPQVVRHYTRLSQLNHSVDAGMYPLGSCTMKYNPKLNDEMASLGGFSGLHPYQDESDAQGLLELLWELEQALLAVTGLTRVSLQPAAGAQGELTAMLMVRAYHRDRGDSARDVVLTPDSAHGTNLATAAMVGCRVVTLPSSDQGIIDLDVLKAALSDRVAALMVTNPNTLGLFEEEIGEITRLVHEAGGLVYYDGANLNAIMGKTRPGDMGVDGMHMNLHKTFSSPHGGGGPGAGPVAVGDLLEPYLPVPVVTRRVDPTGPWFYLDYGLPHSIGRVKGFYGNISVAIRAYAYILRMGAEGLTHASEDAVLSANYMRVRLRDLYDVPYDRMNMHEFVASATRQKAKGVPALNIAKRILDHGVYAPTVYFPPIVPEALMIEPTETEDLATLDEYIEIMRSIDKEIQDDPSLVLEAPHCTPVRRPDEVRAARDPVLRWTSSASTTDKGS